MELKKNKKKYSSILLFFINSIFSFSVFSDPKDGHAVVADGSDSHVMLNDVTIQTTGSGVGLVAIGGTINATGVAVNNLGNVTPDVSAGHGAIAENGGIITLHAGSSIATGAFNSVGLGASGNGSKIITTATVPIVMNGPGATAIYLHDGGQAELVDGFALHLNGSNSVGITADNTTVSSLGKNLVINFHATANSDQTSGVGIVATQGGQLSLESVTIQGVGAGAGTWAEKNSTISLTGNSVIEINANQPATFNTLTSPYLAMLNSQITSHFSQSDSAPIAGLLARGGTINSTGTAIRVTPDNGVGAYASFNNNLSFINLLDNTIQTTGIASYGIMAGENGRISAINTTVNTTGGGAGLFLFAKEGYGSIDLTNSQIHASGKNTAGLLSLNLSSQLPNIISFTNSTLTSEENAVMVAHGGPLFVTASHSALYAKEGRLIEAKHHDAADQPTSVTVSAADTTLTGDIHADKESAIHMTLRDHSFWTGAASDATTVNIGPTSHWLVTHHSTLTQHLSNDGLISFAPSSTFHTITTPHYTGIGTLTMHTYLGGDDSPSDKLIINGGTATGSTTIFVKNKLGPGAITHNGILIVDTINGGTTTENAFALANPGGFVPAGPYAYSLFRGSRDDTHPEAWYLRSAVNCALNSAHPLCNNDDKPSDSESSAQSTAEPIRPNFRPEVSLYTALPSMALFFGQTLLDTLQERVGEEDLKNRESSNHYWSGTWARVVGQQGQNDGGKLGIYGSGPAFDYRLGAIQIGRDFYRGQSSNGSRNHVGLYGATGHLVGDVTHIATQYSAGTNTLTNYSLAAYWTHFGSIGWYIDSVLQGSLDNAKSDSAYLSSLATQAKGIAASIEGGYPFFYRHNIIIEPQAQFIYEALTFQKASDQAADITFQNVESLIGRVGIRFAKVWQRDKSEKITVWIRPHYDHNFQGNPNTLFSDGEKNIAFTSAIGGNWVGINVGVNAKITQLVSLFANANYDKRITATHSDAYNIKVGIKADW